MACESSDDIAPRFVDLSELGCSSDSRRRCGFGEAQVPAPLPNRRHGPAGAPRRAVWTFRRTDGLNAAGWRNAAPHQHEAPLGLVGGRLEYHRRMQRGRQDRKYRTPEAHQGGISTCPGPTFTLRRPTSSRNRPPTDMNSSYVTLSAAKSRIGRQTLLLAPVKSLLSSNSFSTTDAEGEDHRRYRAAGFGFLCAGLLAAVFAVVGALGVDESEVMSVGPGLWRYRFLAGSEFLLWLVACFYPILRRRFCHLHATAAMIVAFTVISHFLLILVLWTGGLNGSVFSATFLSLFGVSIIVPQDRMLKCVLFLIALGESLILLLNLPQRQHNGMLLFLSLSAYLFAGVVRWLIDQETSQ